MKRMFTSATLKLTVSYLLILVSISLIFSFIIFELATSEISSRLERLQIRAEGSSQEIALPGPLTLSDVRKDQTEEARASIFVGLVYMNLAVIGVGGLGAYLLARRTLQPIEAAHDAQSRFTSDASHELRTPLAIMKTEIQALLRDTKAKPSEYKALLHSNLEEIDVLASLSDSLLQLSKLEYEALPLNHRIDIGQVILKLVAKSLSKPERFQLDLPQQPVVVDGNTSLVGDLLNIVIDNALRYSPPETPIRITLTNDGMACKIVIVNDGEGIEKQHLPHIFKHFYRANSARTHSGDKRGHGLGLALAQRIIEFQKGTIDIASTPGKTTVCTITLPLLQKNH